MSKKQSRVKRVHPRLLEPFNEILNTDFSYNGIFQAGTEDEVFVYNSEGPVSADRRNQLINEEEGYRVKELGADMVELVTDPVASNRIYDHEAAASSVEKGLLELLEDDEFLVRYGVSPKRLSQIELSDVGRYLDLIEDFGEKQAGIPEELGRIGYETINPEEVKTPGAVAANQMNIQLPGKDEAADNANMMYLMQSYVAPIVGNSRVIDGKDTGLSDPRSYMWPLNFNLQENEQGEIEQKNYVGKDDWLESWEDYIARMEPVTAFELNESDDELEMANKQNWKFRKLKFLRDEAALVLESRFTPAQPSVEENTAVNAMLKGLMEYGFKHDIDPTEMDIENVDFNYDSGGLYGLEHMLYDLEGELRDAAKVEEEMIENAVEGWDYAGMDYSRPEGPDYNEILEMRLEEVDEDLAPGESTYRGIPSERVATRFKNARKEYDDMEAFVKSVPKVRPRKVA